MSEAIAYAGEPGAFAEDALLSYFGATAPSLSVTSFGDVRAAVLDGRAIFARYISSRTTDGLDQRC